MIKRGIKVKICFFWDRKYYLMRQKLSNVTSMLFPSRSKIYYINSAIRQMHGTTYVEIGVRDGNCFNEIHCKRKIAIDPIKNRNFVNLQDGEQFYEMKSDLFFSNYAEKTFNGNTIDVALVDGWHEFCQSLRDVLNLANYMSPNGIILIHDCNPTSAKKTEIGREGKPWNGDVWKTAFYLNCFQKDLKFFTAKCDQGLGFLFGFERNNNYAPNKEKTQNIKELDYEFLKQNRKKLINLKSKRYAVKFMKNFPEYLR